MRNILFKILIFVVISIKLIGQTPGTKKWEFLTGHEVWSSPAIGSDGTVYVGSRDQKVYALNGETGTKKWEFLTGGDVYSSPAIGSDGSVCVGSFDHRVYALDGETGTKKWEFLTGGPVWSSPAIGPDGTVYVGSYDKKVYALNGATGAKKWEFLTGDFIQSSPAIGSDGTVYVGSFDNKVYALNGATGAKKWEFVTGDWVDSSPAIGSDGTVYVGSFDNKVYALNGATGAKKWEFVTGGVVHSSPAIGSDGTVYVGSYDDKVYALNGATGAKKWEFVTGGWVSSSPAIGSDGTVYTLKTLLLEGPGGSGMLGWKVYALNGATGDKKWESLTGYGRVSYSSPTIGSDGTVYLGSNDGKVFAIYTDSTGLASAEWPMFRGGPSRTGRSQSQQQGDFVWRIQKAGKTMYLGGTVSALRTSDLPFPKSFDTAFSLSQKLILPNDPIEMGGSLAEIYTTSRSMLPSGSNLKLILGDSDYAQLQGLLTSFGLPVDLLLQYRPWFALQFVAQQCFSKNGFDPVRAPDNYYFNLSKSLLKPRAFLDTYQQAVDASASAADVSWGKLIKDRSAEEPFESFIGRVGYTASDLVDMWRLGDVVGIGKMIDTLADRHPDLHSRIIAEPLGRWMPTIESQIQSGQTAFALIRVGHLVGKTGLIQKLRDRGYFVSQMPLSNPFIIRQPVSQWFVVGKELTLSVQATGVEPLYYYWFKDGVIMQGYATNALKLKNLTASNAGRYSVAVSNEVGVVVSMEASLSVVSALPKILTQPQGGQFQEGTNVVIYVEASGQYLSYQWKRDGVDLSGATNYFLTFYPLKNSDKGEYTVNVNNPIGTVTSQPGLLFVTRFPVGTAKWEFLTGGGVQSSPAIGSDGTVYVGSMDNKVYALNGATGAKKWEFLTGGMVYSSPAIGSDGTVYVGSSDQKVYALNGETGVKKWEFLTEGYVWSSPAIGSDGTVYVGSSDQKVYALNGATGAKKWEFLTEGAVSSSPAIGSDGTVYVGSFDKKVYALSGATGAKKWEFQTGASVLSSPAIGSDGTVYVGSDDKKVYALNGATGAKKWEFLTGELIHSSPAIGSDGTVYVGSYDKKVYALNGATGAKKWEFQTGSEVYSSPAIGSDGTVYVGSLDNKVYALNGATGAKKWEFQTERGVVSSPAIGSDGTVYVGSYDGKLYAIASDSMGLMASSWPRYRSMNNSQGQTAPYILIQPKIEGVVVSIGKRVFFEATVISQMPVTLQWSQNGNALPRATNSIFEIPSVTLLNEGYYQLSATLADGRSLSTVFLIALSVPEMLRQPKGGQFQETTNVFLYVEAKGYLLNYQWKRDGVYLAGATNSILDLSILRMADGGQYTVIVSNPFGSVLSNPAAIVVTRLPAGNKSWEFLTGGTVWSSPAIGSDGTVYVGSQDKKVYALNGATGAKKWEFQTGGSVNSSPAIGSDGTVYVGSWDNKVYALNGATGAKKWEFQTGGGVRSSPAIGSDGTVYVGSWDKKVYALNGATGAKKWEFLTRAEVYSSPAIGSDGTVYVGGDNKVYALNGATGAKKWEFLTGSIVESTPAIGSDGTVYVGSWDKKVYALNGATGAKKWEFLTGNRVESSPAIGSDGTVYVGSMDNKVYALNGATGAKKWEFQTERGVVSSPAIGSDGTVYVGSDSGDNKVYALNDATGAKKWEFLTGGGVRSSPAIGSDGTVYVGSDDKVYAIASSSEGLVKSPWPKFHANSLNTGKFPSGSGPLIIIYSPQSGLNLNIPISPDFDTILEYSTNLNQWSEQQRFGRQSNTPSIVVPLKMDQTKSMEYWRTRNQ